VKRTLIGNDFTATGHLVSHSHIDATLLMGKKRVHVVTDHTYSNFRKFSVTTTIVPVES